jgi:hypothetical protein
MQPDRNLLLAHEGSSLGSSTEKSGHGEGAAAC